MGEFWPMCSVEKAVHAAKLSNRILVILVEGKDEVSRKITSAFDLPDSRLLSQKGFNFIGLRIVEGSTSFKELDQIYSSGEKKLSIPYVLFIGAVGLPVSVLEVKNSLDCESFPYRLNEELKRFWGLSARAAVKKVYDHFFDDEAGSFAHPNQEKLKAFRDTYRMVIHHFRETELKNQQASEKTIEKNKLNSEENDCVEVNGVALAVVDKTEENIEDNMNKSNEIIPTDNISNEEVSNGNVVHRHVNNPQDTKILFRLPNGKMVSKVFSVTAKLKEVRQYVETQLSIKSFDLSFLARFKEEEELLTLEQLNMVPSAVLMVIPSSTYEKSVLRKGFSRLVSIFWYLAVPFITYIQYINNFLFGRGRGTQGQMSSSSSSSSNPPPPPPSGGSGPQQPSSQKKSTSKKYRSSNIHTLRSVGDNGNSQNTYNGNSTQQMP